MSLVLDRLPASLELVVTCLAFSVLVSIPLGVLSAVNRGRWLDQLTLSGSLIGISAPPFWVGIMLIFVFAVHWQVLPSSGRGTWMHLILPAFSLSLRRIALFVRLIRSGMLDILSQDFIRTARAKGLSERAVIYKHALKNTLIPFTTIAGLQMGSLLVGAIVTERIFAWPGMGRLILDAIYKLDYPVVIAYAIVTAIMFVIINFVVDITYSLLDPRVRYES